MVSIDCISVFLEGLNNEDAHIRSLAASSLGEAGQPDPRILPALHQALRDPAPSVREAAARALGRRRDAGESSVSLLGACLADQHAEVRHAAVVALGRSRAGAALPALVRSLRDPTPEVRRDAAWAIGRCGRVCGEALGALLEALEDERSDVRYWSAWAIRHAAEVTAELTGRLAAALRDSDPGVQVMALEALAVLGTDQYDRPDDLQEAMIQFLEREGSCRRLAAKILKGLGSHSSN